MHCSMRKPCKVPFKIIMARLTKINKYLPLLPGLDNRKKTYKVGLNNTILHTTPNGWAKKYYLKGWYFESNTYKETCNMFKRTVITEQVYKGVKPPKTTNWIDANRAGHIRNKKGVESASPPKPEKGRSGKHNKINAGNRNNQKK